MHRFLLTIRLFPPALSVVWALLFSVLWLGAGCSISGNRVMLLEDPDMEVYVIDQQEPAADPPDPGVAELSPSQVRASLRRITINHAKLIIFVRSDPKKLLSAPQLDKILEIVLRELPGLTPDQRLGFIFRDQHLGELVDMQLRAEGKLFVYRFIHLMRQIRVKRGPGPEAPNLGKLETLTGQIVETTPLPTLKDSPFAVGARGDEDLF